MAEADEIHLYHGNILSDIAASEAALEVQIEQGLQEFEAYFYAIKKKEYEIAVKVEEDEKWNEMIEAKKLELDGILKQRDDLQKRIASLRCSIENSQKLLEFYEKERIEKQKVHESIAARYRKLIEYQKEKINSYPLVIERNKLKTELLAASVELGVLEYREAEKERQRKQMEEIQRIRWRNAVIKCAQTYKVVKRLKEGHTLMSRELEKNESRPSTSLLEERSETDLTNTVRIESASLVFEDVISTNSVIPTALQSSIVNSPTSISEQPLQHIPDAGNSEIDGVLQNFREKCKVNAYASHASLPTILSAGMGANRSKSDEVEKSEGVENPNVIKNSVNSSENLKSYGMTKNSDNSLENSRIGTDEECNLNGDEILSEQYESSKNSVESNDEMLREAQNMRLRSALISTKLRNMSSTNPDRSHFRPPSTSSQRSYDMVAEEEATASFTEKQNTTRKRVVFKSPPRSMKYMKTERVTSSRNPSFSRHDDLPFRSVDQIERSAVSYEQQAEHSKSHFNEKAAVHKIPTPMMMVTDELKRTSPNDMEIRTAAQESDFVPSVYFNEMATEKNNLLPPILDQRYEYDEYDETEEFNPENDEANYDESMYMARNDEDPYSNQEVSLGEEYLATEEDYLSENEERIPDDDYPAQFEMTMENETAQYDNYSDHNSEIDAEKEHAGMNFEMPVEQNVQFDDEPGTMRPNNNSPKIDTDFSCRNIFDLNSNNSGDSNSMAFPFAKSVDGSADSNPFVFEMTNDNKDLDCNPFFFSKQSSPKEFSFF